MGALRITCPLCRQDFPVPASVTEVQAETHLVTVVLDRTELYGHLQKCAGRYGAPQPSPTKVIVLRGSSSDVSSPLRPPAAELTGRVHRMLDMRAYVATGGSRACTMCGTPGADCLARLERKDAAVPCCSACGNGNTHPAPQDGMTCTEWAADHGAPN